MGQHLALSSETTEKLAESLLRLKLSHGGFHGAVASLQVAYKEHEEVLERDGGHVSDIVESIGEGREPLKLGVGCSAGDCRNNANNFEEIVGKEREELESKVVASVEK